MYCFFPQPLKSWLTVTSFNLTSLEKSTFLSFASDYSRCELNDSRIRISKAKGNLTFWTDLDERALESVGIPQLPRSGS